ncbi:hypothetical protein BDV96DRAFT_598692 [Lophiotrema nucula]|uniref:GAR domain-containing protein n=1 Tax=Lophiotrema nucula TaxID=690887 RepID=A0A6A5ZBK2_9PLEO|nr:hypothetical protein BDV96DRAFT_598692 [Lophiotrema nucula]
MSPGGRRGRTTGTSEEGNLRDLSPTTTLRAFVEKPMPYDTTRDEYKIFACVETLTPAERDLGTRVAKAAQHLKSWCEEIERWGWSGTFEEPSEEYKAERRRSIDVHIREHMKDAAAIKKATQDLPPLMYWGSLESVEVVRRESRLDNISEELLALDVEELKEHVLDIHGAKSRPSSAGYGASRQNYTPMDDFSFLITQTLLSALPHHFQLKDRLNTWTARVSVLREAPRYLEELKLAQKAMGRAWPAIDPPADTSTREFDRYKTAVDTINDYLQSRITALGQQLDRMLDTLEGRDDALPDDWIDTFESVEAEYGKWAGESRRRVLDFDLRRRSDSHGMQAKGGESSETLPLHSEDSVAPTLEPEIQPATTHEVHATESPSLQHNEQRSRTPTRAGTPEKLEYQTATPLGKERHDAIVEQEDDAECEDSVFEEGETVVHNDYEEEEEPSFVSDVVRPRQNSESLSDNLVIVSAENMPEHEGALIRPHTPRSRSNSLDTIGSNISISSSPPTALEESPSVRNSTNRQARAPRPALNAAMSKRRPGKDIKELSIEDTPPWPPTQFFKQTPPNSADDLERKISDILDTIPAHIRLTSSSDPTIEVKSKRNGGVTQQGSKGLLRAARSINGMKSPELTLSPAKADFGSANAASGRKSVAARGDNDIKLYHLTQPGKEHPIKLFIRRVGENGERVMVRVGGGWADLGEYLRQYAEHHGRRAVSDGKFEILGLEIKGTEGSPRPESAMSKRDRRFSGGGPSPSTTPQKSGGVGILKETSSANLNSTPAQAPGETSTPSTGSSRHSWTGNEVGLAGPKSKKMDLSSEKQEWIEGMLKQARTVSGSITGVPRGEHTPQTNQRDGADSRSESRTGTRRPEFGDLGKIGGTKRVFLKGGKLSEH